MNINPKTGYSMGPSVAHELRQKAFSQSDRALYLRERRLKMTDEQLNHERELSKASKAKAKARAVVEKSNNRANNRNAFGSLEKTIRHHLSRGRSVADIAIREFMLVSRVQSIVDQINGPEVAK
jgi:hypothetical protein